jgi:hypothetical protein
LREGKFSNQVILGKKISPTKKRFPHISLEFPREIPNPVNNRY